MLSVLARMSRGATVASFAASYPSCWLVWEPGTWKPPSRDATTMVIERPGTPAPASGEALAMTLTPRPGQAQLTVGRGASGDLVINDGTLSQVHLLLMEGTPGRWTARDARSRNGSWIDGAPMLPGSPYELRDGTRMQAGAVCLTYYESGGLLARLKAHPAFAEPQVRPTA